MIPRATIKSIVLTQAAFYLATGLWPLIHRKSFEDVTGEKKDKWLVNTVGVLVTAIGASLLAGTRSKKGLSDETLILASLSAIGLAGIDLYYVLKKIIPPIYLADAVAESLLIFGIGNSREPRPATAT
jgi:hypothetical protein